MSIDASQDAETRYRAMRTEAAQVVVVPDPLPDADADARSEESALALLPFPPSLLRRSGVYRLDRPEPLPHVPLPPIATRFGTEELRVDVDGVKPTMTVSGTITRLFGGRLTWIARVTKDPATGAWEGPISYRDGDSSLRPHLTVTVRLTGGPFRLTPRKAEATFSGGTVSPVTLAYTFQTAAFREVAFEYDTVSDATAVTSHDPTTHPNHSPAAPGSVLTLESGYARLGIQVTKTGGDSAIPVPAGTLVRPGDARRDAGALVAVGRCSPVGGVGALRPAARPGPVARRHHVRRHRHRPAAGHGDLQRLVHRPGAGWRAEPWPLGGADEVLDRDARDRPRVQPGPLLAEGAGDRVGADVQRAGGAQLHELPVQLPRGAGRVLRGLRLRLQPRRAAVPPARAGALRQDGRGAVVQRPRLRGGLLRAPARRRHRTAGAGAAGAPRAALRVPRAGGGRAPPEERLVDAGHGRRPRPGGRHGGDRRRQGRRRGEAVAAVRPPVHRPGTPGAPARRVDVRVDLPVGGDRWLAGERARQLHGLRRVGGRTERRRAQQAADHRRRPTGHGRGRAAGRRRVHPRGGPHVGLRRVAGADRGQRHPSGGGRAAARVAGGRARHRRTGCADGHRRQGAGARHRGERGGRRRPGGAGAGAPAAVGLIG